MRLCKNFPLCDSYSLAVSGASITKLPNNPWLMQILKEHLKTQPSGSFKNDVLFLLGGTNDFRLRVARADVEREYRHLVRLCLKLFKKVILAKVPPIPLLSAEINEEIRLFNDWLSAFVRNRPDVILLNTFDVFMDPTSKTPNLLCFEKEYFDGRKDLIHLNAFGLFILKCNFLNAMEAL